METSNANCRHLTVPCLALAAAGAAGAALATWFVLLPPSQERPGVVVTADRAALGACLARMLRDAPELASPAGAGPALVSVLSHEGGDASRVVYEGAARLSFVVTLVESAPGRVQTRLLTFPAPDPAPAVDNAVAACAAAKP